MPRRTDIRSILIIGAGPIVIGQAALLDDVALGYGPTLGELIQGESQRAVFPTVDYPVEPRT